MYDSVLLAGRGLNVRVVFKISVKDQKLILKSKTRLKSS